MAVIRGKRKIQIKGYHKMKFEWEKIDRKSFGWTERAKVPGGWLVRTCGMSDTVRMDNAEITHSMAFAMCFVNDLCHEWKID